MAVAVTSHIIKLSASRKKADCLFSFSTSFQVIYKGVCSIKINFGLLLPLAVLAASAFISPAHANPAGDRATVGPALLAQRSERAAQNPQARRIGQPIKGSNYIGVGGSNDGAVVNGKYSLSNNFSVRPEVFTSARGNNGDRGVSVLAPVTYNFNGNDGRVQPFVGAGAGVTTGDATKVQLVTTAGADLRLGDRYALNGSVNYIPFDQQRVNFVAGLGYRF